MTYQVKNIKEYSKEDLEIYNLLTSEEGEKLLNWLEKKYVVRNINEVHEDGILTALITQRHIGRADIYFELKKHISLIKSYLSYANKRTNPKSNI